MGINLKIVNSMKSVVVQSNYFKKLSHTLMVNLLLILKNENF